MVENRELPIEVTKREWEHAKCDKYDYLIAAFCGGAAGLIDVFFVGDPMSSVLSRQADLAADGFVKKAARFFWESDKRTVGKSKNPPITLEQCISYLEQAFPVNYDARYAKDLLAEDGVLSGMRPLNHHLLSLAHSPDPIGLIFSIINQFMGYATFVDRGQLIHVVPTKSSKAIPYLQGTEMKSMLFCGFVNWIGHLLSDIVGSSSTRVLGKSRRGAGIPIPFYELFLSCDFGSFDGNTFAETMIRVFEQGYDLRFGAAMAVPVVLDELMIRVIWMIRQKFVRGKSWQASLPTHEHADLRIMLITGNAVLCAVDGAGAALASGGTLVGFICHLNLIGWARLVMLVLRELRLRYGPVIFNVLNDFTHSILDIASPAEKQRILAFQREMLLYDRQLQVQFAMFAQQVEAEYREKRIEIQHSVDPARSAADQLNASVQAARRAGVTEKNIIHNRKELDDWFL